jgi:hypothetical protein
MLLLKEEKFSMKNNDKASISLKKILVISLVFILFVTSATVLAGNVQPANVKIILSSGYEMNVLTTKTKISEILDENHIILLEDEKTVPDKNSELTDNKTIRITKETEEVVEEAEEIETSENITAEEVLASYDNIVEKIITEQVKIPFETVKKDVSSGSSQKQDKVVQEGKDGLKEITYKVKYQNDKEIEKIKLSEKVVKEPVDKIIEVRQKQTVSRSASVRYSGGKWSYSASELDLLCAITAQECGSSYNGALAVITCAANRAESSKWRKYGSDPLSQYMAPNQFCYSIDSHWRRRLNGNYPSYVKQAVLDALNGKRNHNYLSFRGYSTSGSVNIGGNWYFGSK